MNIFLLCNLLYQNKSLYVTAFNRHTTLSFSPLRALQWRINIQYMGIFVWTRQISVCLLTSLRSVWTWFGSHYFERDLSLGQSVRCGCHAMPRRHFLPVVLSAGKYPSLFEVNGTSPSSAVSENAWRCTSVPQQTTTIFTGLFISPSGISGLDCATTETDTAERSISIGRERLQVFFLY